MSKRRDMRGEALEAAAGNGLIDRRALLGRGAMIAGAMGVGLGHPPLRAPNRLRKKPLTEEPWSLEFGDRTAPIRWRRSSRPRWCAR